MKFRTLLTIVFLSLLLACNVQKLIPSERTSVVIPSGKDVNQSITLSAPAGWNTFKTDDVVDLLVVPYSDHTLILNTNNLLIYQFVNNEWMLIDNEDPHPSMEFIMVPSETPVSSSVSVVAVPELLQQSGEIKLRFVIFANVYDNNTIGDEVEAYTEVTLHP